MGSTVLRGKPRGLGGYQVCLAGPYPGIYLEILDVFGAAELRQAGGPHQGEEVEKEQPVAPQDGVGSLTVTPEPAGVRRGEAGLWVCPQPRPLPTRPAPTPAWDPPAPSPFKFLTVIRFPLLDHVHKVIREDERDSLTVDSKLGLEIAQKVAEINVEELRRGKLKRSERKVPRSGKGVRGVGRGSLEGDGHVCVAARSAPTCPFSRIMMLSLCRSPMPST